MGPQIIAMGGIPDEPDSLLLEKYLLEATGKEQPKITLLPTASGDSQESIDRFYDRFGKLDAVPSHLSLFRLTVTDRRDLLLKQDAIYVGGGSTHNMLLLWRDWGLVSILKEAWRNGIVLCGVSAGSICWFEQGVTDSLIPDRLVPLRGLGFLEGSNCPHYDSEPLRRPTCHDLLKRGFLKAGYAGVKAVSPATQVILHLGKVDVPTVSRFFNQCVAHGVPWDIIGCSYYPFWTKLTSEQARTNINQFYPLYNKPVLIMETGYNWSTNACDGWPGQLSNNGPEA